MTARAGPHRRLRSPICFYGGKGQLAHRILPLLPPHEVYLEPFFGGGSVFFAKPPAALETVNDIDEAVVGFYRVLRDPGQFAAFCRMAELTPNARAEYEECRRRWRDYDDPILRAWAWFVMVRQAFGGGARGESGWKSGACRTGATNSWGYRKANLDASAGRRWLGAVEGLPAIHARLQGVQVECGDWRRVLDAYEGRWTLAYLDPPYVLQTRTGGTRYAHEMSLQDHHDLSARLLTWTGMAVLSGYRHEATHEPLEAAGWERVDLDVALHVSRQRAGMRRTESVWSNPAAVAARSQPSLFGSEEVPRG